MDDDDECFVDDFEDNCSNDDRYYDEFEDGGSSGELDERHYDALNDETFGLSGDQSEFDWELEHESYSKTELSASSLMPASNYDNGRSNQKENKAPVVPVAMPLSPPLPPQPSAKTHVDEARLRKEAELIRALMNQMSLRTAAAAVPATASVAPPKNIMSVEELERQMLQKQPPPPPPPQQTFMPLLRQPRPQQPQIDPRLAAMLGQQQQQQQQQQQYLQRQQQLYQLAMLRHQQLLMLQQRKEPSLSAFYQPFSPALLNAAAMTAPTTPAVSLNYVAAPAPAPAPLPSLLSMAPVRVPDTQAQVQLLRGTDLRFRSDSNSVRTTAPKDTNRYCNLLTRGERQWLLSVQLAQLRTLTPFIDDFYYCSFMEKRRREGQKYSLRHANNQMSGGGGGSGGSSGGIAGTSATPHKTKKENDEEWRLVRRRMYTTGKFENSLGKLQQASFYAPRKFCEFYSSNVNASVDYDYRRAALVHNTAQSENCRYRIVLLEIEEFMRRLLYYEDLLNPLMVMNMKRQKDIKEKQHLKEIETSENVEKAMFNFQKELNESIKSFEDPDTVLNSILNNILSLERLSSYLNIRKGKSFIIRLLKHLQVQVHGQFLYDFWRLFMQVNLFAMYKKDKLTNDHMVPEFYNLFKKFVYNCDFTKIFAIFAILTSQPQPQPPPTSLNRVRNQTPQPLFAVSRTGRETGNSVAFNSRYTPISFIVKPQIHFLLTTKFGNSCITSLILRTEYLLLSNKMTADEITKWNRFLVELAEIVDDELSIGGTETKTTTTTTATKPAVDSSLQTKPEEPISRTLMQKIVNRNPCLTRSQIDSLFENFTDS